MAKKREKAEQQNPEQSTSVFDGFDLSAKQKKALQAVLPDNCYILSVACGADFVEFVTGPDGQKMRAYCD